MSASQGSSRNKIDAKTLCRYALFTALCLIFSYIESLLPLSFIAPGVKLGLSNAVALLLAARKDYKGALLVNIARILLSALLFGSAVSLMFAISGGVCSLAVVCLLSLTDRFSAVGMSIAGGVIHNVVQCFCAMLILNTSVIFYMPVLIAAGAVSGSVIGVIDLLILKKIKTNGKF